jgi:hypothetical protein
MDRPGSCCVLFANAARTFEDILALAHHALLWGIKAAQAGLPLSSNPYRSPSERAAWQSGYRRISEPFESYRRS